MDNRLDNLTDATEKALDFWQQKLANALPLLELPYDHQRPVSQHYHMGTQLLPLEPSAVEHLATLAENYATPTFTIVLTVLQTLLGRYTGQEDILLGMPVVDEGKLINLVPLRTVFDEHITFTETLQHISSVLNEVKKHQALPFHTLVQALDIPPDPSHHPLFQVLFAQGESLTIGNLHALTPIKCDLTCVFKETQLLFAYDKTLFDAATIERLSGHFQVLLHAILAKPNQSLASYPLLTEAEYQQVLVDWNSNHVDYEPACVHHLFEAQVAKTPEAIAAVFENEQLTFKELNQKANQITHYLRTQGVRAESFVGVCVERSLYLAIGALGILKAGGAYVSLDPAYPKKRLQFMLQDTRIATLLTQQHLVAELPESQAHPICLDTEWSIFDAYPTDNVTTEVTWDNLAYIIYTSGSTGNPKGVMITHHNLVDYILSIRVPMEINDQDVYLQTASFGFSSSVRQLFVPLTQGARIVVASSEQRLNPIDLFKLIQAEKVTIIDLVPSHWRQCIDALSLLSESEQQALLNNDLRLFLSASEPLLSDLPRRWRKELKHPARLVNMFGQTETTGIATTCPMPESHDNEKVKIVAVGRPMANVQIYLLNSVMQPVPIGVYGEMFIGGTHVGRGYLNLPENTAASFIPDPFNQNAILYKTGDLARYLADGTIEFLGRQDNQVKIRGFRIELGEVEATLTQHADIRSAVVIAREDEPGNKRLVGYVVLKPERELYVSALRQFMQEKLPDYMVPAAFVVLDAIPLTPNGKIDRRALPAPSTSVDNLEGGFVAPTNATEEILAKIWANVLRLDKVGMHNNFFDLGGTSLLAVNLLAEIEHTFGRQNLSLMSIFQAPTVAQLATVLRQENYQPAWRTIEVIQPEGTKPPLFFVGSTRLARSLLPQLGKDQPVYGINVFGVQPADGSLPDLKIEKLASQCVAEIQTVQPHGPYYIVSYCGDAKTALEMGQQLYAKGEKLNLLAFFDGFYRMAKKDQDYHYFKHHFDNLSDMGVGYFFHKLRQKIHGQTRNLRLKFLGLIGARKKRQANTLSTQLQYTLFINRYLDELTLYHPKHYPGKLTLFYASEWRFKQAPSIEKLAHEGIEIITVKGYHDNLFDEPQATELGQKLKIVLEKNQ